MEVDRPSLRQRVRNAAHRSGLTRLWRWWVAELASAVPAASRSELQRRRLRPVIELASDNATTVATVWKPDVADHRARFTAIEQVSLAGDPDAVSAAGAQAMSRLREAIDVRARPLKVVVALSPRQVLKKELVLPAAVEENLHQTLAYDLDRHTPFRPEQLYFDAVVVDRGPRARTIRVQWAAALKTIVDSARRQVESWGAAVESVVPGPVSVNLTRLNLVPVDDRPRAVWWRRWDLWVPAAVTAVLLLAAVMVPLAQKREYAAALAAQAEQARVQAESADALRQKLARLQDDYNFVLAKKYAFPSTMQVLDDVTRLMPDDTWLTQLELKTNSKGKEVQRDMLIRGETANASRLIGPLEESKLVEQAAPRSPTTKIQPGPGEIFDLGAQIRAATPPAAIALAPAGVPGTTPGVPATAPVLPNAGPAPPAVTTSTGSVTPGASTGATANAVSQQMPVRAAPASPATNAGAAVPNVAPRAQPPNVSNAPNAPASAAATPSARPPGAP